MKAGFVALACFIALATANMICDDRIADAVNSNPSSTWKAACSPRFAGKSLHHAKRLLMSVDNFAALPETSSRLEYVAPQVGAIPDTFDARTEWPTCVHPIRDQQQCGSCWAFGATEALSDRFCIQSNGSVNVVLSPQDLVSCDNSNSGCNGGRLDAAWSYMVRTGVALDSCEPYASGTGVAPPCPKTCTDGSAIKKYKAKNSYHVGSSILFWKRVSDIQAEILANGPVETGFEVYQDFMQYSSGVYSHTSGSLLGGHAVKIVGWGTENGTPYWLVANSWGENWGLQGFFKIKRGNDECMFEAQVYAGLAAV